MRGRKVDDGRGRLGGGMARGTTCHRTNLQDVQNFAFSLLTRTRRRQFVEDLDSCEPAERAKIVGRIIAAALENKTAEGQAVEIDALSA